MPKKILITITNDISYDQRMQRIATTLCEAGYKVKIIGRKKKNSVALKPNIFEQKRLNCFFENGKLFYIEFNIRLLFYLLFQKFDIINAVDLDTLGPCFIMAKLKKKPLVYDSHELYTEVPELIHRPKTQKVWLALEQYILPKIKRAYTVSQTIADYYTQKYGVKFGLVRNMPLLQTLDLKVVEVEKYLLYQGALNVGRGLELLLEAMTKIDIKLKIIGDGDIAESLKNKCNTLNINEKIDFLGYLSPKEMQPFTQNAWLGINISENLGLSYYYSLNNKFFDYVQAGLPALINDFPEYVSLMQMHKVGLITAYNVENIVANVNELLANETLYNTLKTNCLAAKTEWHWGNEKRNLLKVYAEL